MGIQVEEGAGETKVTGNDTAEKKFTNQGQTPRRMAGARKYFFLNRPLFVKEPAHSDSACTVLPRINPKQNPTQFFQGCL